MNEQNMGEELPPYRWYRVEGSQHAASEEREQSK